MTKNWDYEKWRELGDFSDACLASNLLEMERIAQKPTTGTQMRIPKACPCRNLSAYTRPSGMRSTMNSKLCSM